MLSKWEKFYEADEAVVLIRNRDGGERDGDGQGGRGRVPDGLTGSLVRRARS